jgi:hypothetical protein
MVHMTIRVRVQLLPGVRPVRGERNFEIELQEGATVRDLLLAAGFRESEIEYIRVWVGKNLASLHTVLRDSDDATVGVPLGGG